jgi:predicted MFS family arabinose efflux permease
MLQASLHLYKKAYSGISRPIWLLSLVIFVNRSGTMVIPFLTVYLTHRGYTLTQAGMVMATFGTGAILGGYIGGRLTDLLGSFYVQFASLFMNGILFIILGYMQSLWQISLLVFLLSSIGESFRPANAAAIAAYSTPANRTRCYSLNRLAINLGWSIGPALGGILAGISFRLLFWTDGITAIAASILLFIFLFDVHKKKSQEKKQEPPSGALPVYKDRIFLFGMFFLMLIATTFFQLFSIIPVYYRDYVHLSVPAIGWVLGLNGLVIALVEMVIVYKLENRRKPLVYMFAGGMLMGLSFLVLASVPVLIIVICSMLFITIGEMLLFPFTNNFWVSRTTSHNRGRYAAAYTITFAFANIIAPLFGSGIARHGGFPVLFLCNFILCAVGSFGFLWLGKKGAVYGV